MGKLDPKTMKALITAVCETMPDAQGLAIAKAATMKSGGHAARHLEHHLSGGGKALPVDHKSGRRHPGQTRSGAMSPLLSRRTGLRAQEEVVAFVTVLLFDLSAILMVFIRLIFLDESIEISRHCRTATQHDRGDGPPVAWRA